MFGYMSLTQTLTPYVPTDSDLYLRNVNTEVTYTNAKGESVKIPIEFKNSLNLFTIERPTKDIHMVHQWIIENTDYLDVVPDGPFAISDGYLDNLQKTCEDLLLTYSLNKKRGIEMSKETLPLWENRDLLSIESDYGEDYFKGVEDVLGDLKQFRAQPVPETITGVQFISHYIYNFY